MIFEYNEDLTLNERTENVFLEIQKEYPEVERNAAICSSLLSSPVDDKPTNDEKFERYYFLLKYSNINNPEYNHIFNDLYEVYEDGLESDIYNQCMGEIINYMSGLRTDFPVLSNFYSE